jgi:hypothetical protein
MTFYIFVTCAKAKISLVGSIVFDISFDGVSGESNPLVNMC